MKKQKKINKEYKFYQISANTENYDGINNLLNYLAEGAIIISIAPQSNSTQYILEKTYEKTIY
jgi:hypothetical protein